MSRQYDQKYRFSIVNSCEIVDSYPATEIVATDPSGNTLILMDTHGLNPGDWVSLTGFSPYSANIITQVIEGTPEDAGVSVVGIPGIDELVLGTVNKLYGKRYLDPLNFYESEFEWSQEEDEIYFRQLFNSPLKFINEDYDYFRDYILTNECCEIKFFIEKKCDGAWRDEWGGYFTHNSCVWNQSHCWVEANFEVDDPYRCLLSNYEDPHTIFDTLTYFERLECCGQAALGNIPGTGTCSPPCYSLTSDALSDAGGDVIQFDEDQIIEPCDGSSMAEWQLERDVITQVTFENAEFNFYDICTTWVREVAITLDIDGLAIAPAGTGWTMRAAVIYNGFPAHKWTRRPYGGIYYNFSDYTIVRDCDDIPCVRTWSVTFPDPLDDTTTRTPLGEVLNLLIAQTCPQLEGFRSDFFEIDAPGDTPGYVAGTNYVTGAASQILNLMVQQVSAFITVSNEYDEIYSDLTLKDMLGALKIMFNCKWFVDADGFIRMEHISWFQRTVLIDTTVGADNILRNKSKKQFKYDRQDMPMREKFNFIYQGYKDFVGLPIIYQSPCVNYRKTVTYQVPKFSTDVQYIRDGADEFKDFNSFLLVACDADDAVLSEVGELTGESRQNAHLSWANLHENYHKHHRYLDEGIMNDALTAFLSVRKTKRQVPITHAGCCTIIDPLNDLVRTQLGDGQIDKMRKSNRDDLFTFELLY
jgi:hypothetical protein